MTRYARRVGCGRARIALLASMMVATNRLLAGDMSMDPRLRVIEYQPTAVIPLTAFVGYHVHLEFAADEQFVNLASGDTAVLDVAAEGNHLLLKPRHPIAGTNLTILTNRRTYFLDYRALARVPRGDEAVYSMVFHYPAGDAARATRPDASGAPLAPTVAPRSVVNANYWYCGSQTLKPVSAADDGLQLRLIFAPHAEWPAVYVGEVDGTETLLNFHVENDTMIIHRLASRLVLRRGGEVGCLVDRSVRTNPQRASTGTVDPSVDRETREPPQ